MNKSAKILSLILSVAMGASVFSLAACSGDPETPPGPGPQPEHTHTFAATWTSDESEHWHAATCEHTTEKSGVAKHDGNGADGACSVCGHVHTHTFDTEWTYNTANHWHAATCDHSDEISGKAKHTPDANGKCTVCDYAPHVHTYNAEAWTTNDVYHWRAATCDHTATAVNDQAKHTFDANGKCTVCDFQHNHKYNEKYWAVNATKHWRQPECEHQTTIKDEADHTWGADGRCTVCKYIPLGSKIGTDSKGNDIFHTHTYKWSAYLESHYQSLKCSDENNCKSCAKNLNTDAPRSKNIAKHTYGADNKCTVCNFNNTWGYTDDCIKCDVCEGCIKTMCVHDGEADHKKCQDKGANTKTYTIEAENGEVYKSNGDPGSILDYTYGSRECIHTDYSNVRYTIESTKECYVTLKLKIGRGDIGESINKRLTVFVNDNDLTSNAIMAQPNSNETKCSLGWITFGCIKLEEGTNVVEICQFNGGDMFHMDKIELLTAADVDLTWTNIDNSRLHVIKEWKPMPQDPPTA